MASLVLTRDNAQIWNSNLHFAGTNDLNLGLGTVSLGSTAGTRTVTVDTKRLTIGGIISNGTATALAKAGAGTLVLGGVNTYNGGTTIDAGTLTVNDGATLGASTGGLVVNNPNTGSGTAVVLNLLGNVATGSLSGAIATPSDGTNTATINIAATKSLTVNQTTDGVYAGTLAGDGKLVKNGGGMLTLAGTNTYAGGTTLDDGTLSVGSLSALGTGGLLSVQLNSGTFQYTGHGTVTTDRLSLSGGAVTMDITQSDANLTMTDAFHDTAITKKGAGTLTLAGNVYYIGYNFGSLNLSVDEGTMVLASTVTSPAFMDTVNVVTDVKTGATLKLGNAQGRQIVPGNAFHMSGGTFDLNGNTNNYEPQIDGTGTVTNSNVTAASLMVYPSSTKTFSGDIVNGVGTVGLQFTNLFAYGANQAAVWTLAGNNTYSGATTVGVGTLKAGSATAFSPNSAFKVDSTLDLAGHDNTIAGLAGAGIVKSSTGSAVLTVSNNTASYVFTGSLQNGGGTLGLTKTGSQMLTLSGSNDYTGNTTIQAGTLKLDGSGSIASSAHIIVGDTPGSTAILDVSSKTGGFTLGSTQTLSGSGGILGTLHVGVGGTLAPGNSIESMVISGGSLIMDPGSSFAYEYNSGLGMDPAIAADLVKVAGDVTLTGVNLNLRDLANPAGLFTSGTVLSLITYTGNLTGGFFDLADNATVTLGANMWKINYGTLIGGDNFRGDYFASELNAKFITLTLTLTAIPEPSSLLALGCLVGSGAFLRSRRRRQ